jgi:hypothetical protein
MHIPRLAALDRPVAATTGTRSRSPASESQRRQDLAESEYMRKHGVPNFPDPTFLSSGGTSVSLTGLNPQSPAFKQA